LSELYEEDLAAVHSAAYSDLSLHGGGVVLELLRSSGIESGLIVDLGCGGGEWLARASGAGYETLGVDISRPMAELARRNSPRSTVRVGSLYHADLPPCVAVTSFGEGLCYGTPDLPTDEALGGWLARASAALLPRGVLAFDVVVTGEPMRYRYWNQGEGFAVLIDVDEVAERDAVIRDITLFRRVGELYRRSHEIHEVRAFAVERISDTLSALGMDHSISTAYGQYELGPRRRAFTASSSSTTSAST
jgi:SAM-dependent methyltransferase